MLIARREISFAPARILGLQPCRGYRANWFSPPYSYTFLGLSIRKGTGKDGRQMAPYKLPRTIIPPKSNANEIILVANGDLRPLANQEGWAAQDTIEKCIGRAFAKLGMTIRAVGQNADVARSLGVPADRIYALTMGTSSALAASAGSLVATIFWVVPTSGSPLALKGFIIVILGGLGSIPGALIGSYIIGLTEAFSVVILPSQYKELVGILVMLGVLFLRPFGLFGEEDSI